MKKLLSLVAVVALLGAGCSFNSKTDVDANVNAAMEAEQQNAAGGTMLEGSGEGNLDNDMVGGDAKVNVDVDADVNVGLKTHTVAVQNFAFATKTLTMKKGDKVTFTNKDSVAHTATANNEAFDLTLNANSSATLDTSALAPGTYKYYCIPHPSMTGTIIVE
ncbi:MAG: cupredoxin domain-containing protein [Patescibacteria group bacterium]|jgi:plastocyanin